MTNHSTIYCDVREKEVFSKSMIPKQYIKPNFDLEQENGKIIRGKDLSYLGNGENSSIWKYNDGTKDYALKIFFYIGRPYSLAYNTYVRMKDYELKYTLSPLDTCKVIENKKEKYYYDAYLMDLLEKEENWSILEMPTSLLLENVEGLELDLELLTENNIRMLDCKEENIILNKNNQHIYISDIDMFRVEYDTFFSDLIEANYDELFWILFSLFKSGYHQEYKEMYKYISYADINHFIVNILSYRQSNNIGYMTSELYKQFGFYDTPKQFFKDHAQKCQSIRFH